MRNVLIRITYDWGMNALDFDSQDELVGFSDKYLKPMEEVLEELNKESMKDLGVEQYRIMEYFDGF